MENIEYYEDKIDIICKNSLNFICDEIKNNLPNKNTSDLHANLMVVLNMISSVCLYKISIGHNTPYKLLQIFIDNIKEDFKKFESLKQK